jgi:hypothetical protein
MTLAEGRLLPVEAFAPIFEPLKGKRIGYVRPRGNVGDALIEWATRQLLEVFGITWTLFDPEANDPAECDELVFGGGGNMGTRYPSNWDLRGRLLALGLPITVFPQSFTSREDRPYRRVYVRERASLALCPGGIIAPDLALGLHPPECLPPVHGLGIFLRRDAERLARFRWFRIDPARRCQTPQAYLALAATCERIVTDRLHFAICGLLAGRQTTLIANDYHKNASMYDTWLRSLGCRFARSAWEALGWGRAPGL